MDLIFYLNPFQICLYILPFNLWIKELDFEKLPKLTTHDKTVMSLIYLRQISNFVILENCVYYALVKH